jgi:hypothetical protein
VIKEGESFGRLAVGAAIPRASSPLRIGMGNETTKNLSVPILKVQARNSFIVSQDEPLSPNMTVRKKQLGESQRQAF